MKPEHHVFVCINDRGGEASMPSCGPNGGSEVLASFLSERARRGLYRELFITETRCLGICPPSGATVVVYPDGVWYVGVSAADVRELFDEHFVGGRPLARLRDPRFV